MLDILTRQLKESRSLAREQIQEAVAALTDEQIPAVPKAEFLSALAQKGETPDEIAEFARALRDRAVAPPLDQETRQRLILDVCGTGGDRLNTFNISSTVALILASAGVTVAKHGNRAITSQAGSADVFEALGIQIDLLPEQAAQCLRDHHFAFFFAPKYHPAFKHIAPARKLCAERGQRTIFNFLGPLLNPARPTAQLMGVPQPALCEPIARVLQSLGLARGMVVCGHVTEKNRASSSAPDSPQFLDEISTLGDTLVAEFYQERGFHTSTLTSAAFPFQPAALSDLAGGDRQANAEIVRRLLSGQDHGPRRDAVLVNSAAALFVAGQTKTIVTGWDLAADLLDSGTAVAKLAELQNLRYIGAH